MWVFFDSVVNLCVFWGWICTSQIPMGAIFMAFYSHIHKKKKHLFFPCNVKSGLCHVRINQHPVLNQPPSPPPPIFLQFKNRWSPRTKKRFGRTCLINHQCWNPILFYFPTLFIFKWFPISILKLKPHEHQNPSLLIIEKLKKKLFPKWSISD